MTAISVVGLGKLGLPLAAVLAEHHDVVGIEANPHVADAIANGRCPYDEPGLAERLPIKATTDSRAVRETDATFIVVPTPSQEDGKFSNEHILRAISEFGPELRGKEGYHLVVVVSTVMPGSCDALIRVALEKFTGRSLGVDLGLCYSPEFIALGNVIEGLKHPDFVLIGHDDILAFRALEQIYDPLYGRGPGQWRMPRAIVSLVEAEIAKIAVNTYVTMKISFANVIGAMCERLNADAGDVAGAIGLDPRIGKKYLWPATAYGGPCFPRDTEAFAAIARDTGAGDELPRASKITNHRQVNRLCNLVGGLVDDGGVAILGLAYKPGTPVTDASVGMELANWCRARDLPYVTYDPKAPPLRHPMAPTAQAAVEGAEVVVITQPMPEFSRLTYRAGQKVVDCWRFLHPAEFCSAMANGAELIQLGKVMR